MLDILKLSMAEPINSFNPQLTHGSLMEDENIPEVEDEKFVKQQNEHLKELEKPIINPLHDNLFKNESRFDNWHISSNDNLVSWSLMEQESIGEQAQINMNKVIEINNALQQDNLYLAKELLQRDLTDDEIQNKSISGKTHQNRSYLNYENKEFRFQKDDPNINQLVKTLAQLGVNYSISSDKRGILIKTTQRYLQGHIPVTIYTEDFNEEEKEREKEKEEENFDLQGIEYLKSFGLTENFQTEINKKSLSEIKELCNMLNVPYKFDNLKQAKDYLKQIIKDKAQGIGRKRKTKDEVYTTQLEKIRQQKQKKEQDEEEKEEEDNDDSDNQYISKGEGIKKIKKDDKFVPFGKYMLSLDKLKDNIIKITTMKKNRTGIPFFYVSSKMKDLITRALRTGKIYSNDIMNLSQEEQAILDTILTRSKADVEIVQEDNKYNKQSLNLKNEYMTDRSLKRRLKILVGSQAAGNNNNDLKREIALLSKEAQKRGIKL